MFQVSLPQTRTCLLQVLETTSSNHSDLLLKPKNLHEGFMLEKKTQPHQKVFLSPRSVSTIPAPEERVAYSIYRMFVIPVLHTYLMQECS